MRKIFYETLPSHPEWDDHDVELLKRFFKAKPYHQHPKWMESRPEDEMAKLLREWHLEQEAKPHRDKMKRDLTSGAMKILGWVWDQLFEEEDEIERADRMFELEDK